MSEPDQKHCPKCGHDQVSLDCVQMDVSTLDKGRQRVPAYRLHCHLCGYAPIGLHVTTYEKAVEVWNSGPDHA